jgi:amidase
VKDSVALDATSPSGPLADTSFVVKDLIAVAGHTSSFGLASWRESHEPAARNAVLVDRLLAAGARMAGLVKLDQLAYSLIGNVGEGDPPINAQFPERFAGGSSSGSAAAVGAGLVDFAIGTDTGGSVRVPAAACGVCSIRPTHDAIVKHGVVPLAPSFDVVGVFARESSTLAAVLELLAPTLSQSTTISDVVLPNDVLERLDEPIQDALRLAAARLAAAVGGEVRDAHLGGFVDSDTGDLFARLQGREIWRTHGRWVADHADGFAPDVKTRLDRCRTLQQSPPAEKVADVEARSMYAARLSAELRPDSIAVLPIVPGPGPDIAWSDEQLLAYRTECFRLTAPASLTGRPQAAITLGAPGRRATVGLLGRRGSDLELLRLAEHLESDGS